MSGLKLGCFSDVLLNPTLTHALICSTYIEPQFFHQPGSRPESTPTYKSSPPQLVATYPTLKLNFPIYLRPLCPASEYKMVVDENHQTRLLSTLKEANLVPGPASSLIPAEFKPTTQLNVSFGSKAVDLGNLFRVSEVKNAPSLSFESEVRSRISIIS